MGRNNLERLITKETKVIERYLIKIGVKKEDAEDIVQDAVCKAIEYIDSIDSDKLMSWLFKVSLNSFYNLHNKRKKLVIELDEKAVLNLCSDELLETQLITSELNENVRATLDLLKESYRNLITMKYFMDLSYKEIAKILGFDERKVKMYLYRARNKFIELWEESGYEK